MRAGAEGSWAARQKVGWERRGEGFVPQFSKEIARS